MSTSIGSPLLQPRIPETLPISSGTSDINQKLNNTNLQIQTLISQSQANTLYDPKPPPYESNYKLKNKEGFIGASHINTTFLTIGLGLIVIGIALLSKNQNKFQ